MESVKQKVNFADLRSGNFVELLVVVEAETLGNQACFSAEHYLVFR